MCGQIFHDNFKGFVAEFQTEKKQINYQFTGDFVTKRSVCFLNGWIQFQGNPTPAKISVFQDCQIVWNDSNHSLHHSVVSKHQSSHVVARNLEVKMTGRHKALHKKIVTCGTVEVL